LPAQVRKPGKVAIGQAEDQTVLDSERGQMRVRNKLRSLAYNE
jgi:hypothetical protein